MAHNVGQHARMARAAIRHIVGKPVGHLQRIYIVRYQHTYGTELSTRTVVQAIQIILLFQI